MTSSFLPITHAEALERGWEQLDFVYIILGTLMWTTPALVLLSSRASSSRWAFPSASSPNRLLTAITWNSASLATLFWSPAATSTRWSPTIPLPNAAAATMPTPPAAKPADVPTAPPSSTPANCASFTPIPISSSVVWRLRCAALPTTTTGTMRCALPSCWIHRQTCCCTAWGKRSSPS